MINTTSSYPLIIAVLILIISVFISFYFYNKSPLTAPKKYFLLILKAFALFNLCILFIEPAFFYNKKSTSSGSNIILIDNSRSNELQSSDKNLKELQIKNLLKGFNEADLYKAFCFSTGEPKNISFQGFDSISFNGYETNLNDAIPALRRVLQQGTLNSITILSDGNFNSGGNPYYRLKEFTCPVFTIGIGDTLQQKDVVVEKVIYNDKAFINTKNIIKVFISAYGFANESLSLILQREGNNIENKTFKINRDVESIEADFDITETKEGIVKYSFTAEKKNGELTYHNNRADFLIKYLNNKINLLYISSGPGYDNLFILDILKRINNFNVTSHVLKNQIDFYEGQIDYNKLGDYSIIFLMGFPSLQTNKELVDKILQKNKEFNISVIFFAQKNTDYKKLESLDEFLPFSINKISQGENLILLKTTGVNEIAGNSGSIKEDFSGIDNAPQIFKNISGIIPKAGSVVLATETSSREPILIIRNTGNFKSTAFLGYGLWRWGLNNKASDIKLAEKFIYGIVNQTILDEKREGLAVTPVKNLFDYTENIVINAEVYDNNYHPVNTALVKADIFKNGQKYTSVSFNFINNTYTTSLPPIPTGDYTIEAHAVLDNNAYADVSSRFLIDTISTEFSETKSNFDALRTISLNTCGSFFKTTEFSAYNDSFKNLLGKNIGQETTAMIKFNFRENRYILILIVLLFSLEWFFRKRNNIP